MQENGYHTVLMVVSMNVKTTNTSTSTGIKKVETRQLSLEEIDARLKRVELIVIRAQK